MSEEKLAIQNPYISEGPSSNNVICNELEKLVVSEIPTDIKTRIFGYLYPNIFRSHQINRQYAIYFLSEGYIAIGRMIAYEHRCMSKELLDEVFHRFMTVDKSLCGSIDLLSFLYSMNIEIPTNEKFDKQRIIEVNKLFNSMNI